MIMEGIFSIAKDRFNGITINTKNVKFDTDTDFETKLKASLATWKDEGIRGVWIKVNKEDSSLIPICIQAGFEFHHAQPRYVMMNMWLPTEEENMLPGYASHFIGCSGFVVNDENQVLVIKEKYDPPKRQWNLPGGCADPGEDIADAAQREVLEETGVEADFETLLSIRHTHHYNHGCSDLDFVCLMRAKTTFINACRKEIEECCWMDIDEYIKHKEVTPGNRYIAQMYKEYLESPSHGSIQPEPVLSHNKKFTHLIYSIHPPNTASNTADTESG